MLLTPRQSSPFYSIITCLLHPRSVSSKTKKFGKISKTSTLNTLVKKMTLTGVLTFRKVMISRIWKHLISSIETLKELSNPIVITPPLIKGIAPLKDLVISAIKFA